MGAVTAGVGRRADLLLGAAVVVSGARLLAPTAAAADIHASAMGVLALVALQHAWSLRSRVGVDRSWVRYVWLMVVTVVGGALSGWLASRALAVVVTITVLVGAWAVAVHLYAAFDLRRSSVVDLIDGALLGIVAVFLAWVFLLAGLDDPLLQTVLAVTAFVGFGYPSLILLTVRLHPLSRTRLLTAIGMASGSAGLVVSSLQISTGRYAGSTVGSTLIMLGTAALVAGMWADREPEAPADAPIGRRDMAWWGPVALLVAVLTGVESLAAVPTAEGTVRELLLLAAAVGLLARVILTVRQLTATADALRVDRAHFRRRALSDPLTGLANRPALARHLAAALTTTTADVPVTVLYCDLDRLKVINDALGHDVGDLLITEVAMRWRGLMDDHTLLARVGGDEFVVCTTTPEPLRLAQALHDVLREPVAAGETRLTTRTSIGVATTHDPATDPSALLRDADAAMYHAKALGGGVTAVFDEQIRAGVLRRLEIERHLPVAIASGDIEVHVQPIVDLQTGAVAGMESLMRWAHPTLGAVDPEEVVAVAEDTGLILDLGEMLLDRSLAVLRSLWDDGLPMPRVSVNTSSSQLATDGYATDVQRALRRHDLPASALTLEVTEQVLLDPEGPAADALDALDRMDVTIAMDDFGTGYSSLSYLGRVGFHQLKLDGAFQSSGHAPVGVVVLDGVLRIARGLGLPVIAEGIETAAQVRRLRDLGCDMAQGYYFSPPLPPPEMATWLRQREFGVEDPALLLLDRAREGHPGQG